MTFAKRVKNALFAAGACLVMAGVSQAANVPVTNGLVLWLDAADASTVIVDPIDGGVVQWVDKSGLSNNAAQFTPVNRPDVNATALNGMPAIRFDGVDDGMSIADSLSLQREYTVFTIDQYYGTVQGRSLQSREAGVNWLTGKWGGGNSHYSNGWVTNTNTNIATIDVPVIGEAVGNFGSSRYYIDGTNRTAGAAVDTAPGIPGRLGLVGSGTNNEQSNLDVSEIVIFDRALTKTERHDVGSYLADKWGIASTYLDSSTFQDHGTVTQFTGADPGEGLDLQGNIVYQVAVGGLTEIQGANARWLPDTLTNGVTVSANNHLPVWATRPEMGNTSDDNILETALHSIRWSSPLDPTPEVDVTLDVIPGHTYKLQALFTENIPNLPAGSRVFEPSVNGQEQATIVVDTNAVAGTFAGPSGAGAVYTYQFTATGNTATFNLSGASFGKDTNPALNALTLEDLTDTTPSNVAPILGTTTVGNFTGGDLGEGIDLEGDIVQAININGPDTMIRGINFVSDVTDPNFIIVANSALNPWPNATAHDYGPSADDDALESVMRGIRYDSTSNIDINLLDLEVGEEYKLQLLFDEGCCDRGADIFVEGLLIADDVATGVLGDGMGTIVTYLFEATDDVLSIQLSALDTTFADKFPLIQALTLEKTSVIPEPSAFSLMLIGGMFAAMKRRRA